MPETGGQKGGGVQNEFTGIVDTRILGKPKEFRGNENEYLDWKFAQRQYLRGALPPTLCPTAPLFPFTRCLRNVGFENPQTSFCGGSQSQSMFAGSKVSIPEIVA